MEDFNESEIIELSHVSSCSEHHVFDGLGKEKSETVPMV
jgi:hypothetical protein